VTESTEKEREQQEKEEISDLSKWLSLGFGQKVKLLKMGSHTSKSCELPIVGAVVDSSPVLITWFAQNFYFYFLGIYLTRQIPATLLYPISGIFQDVPLSGHVNKEAAPDLPNFEKAYHNCEDIKCFGSDTKDGFGAALAIRYLQEVAKLDSEAILDVCLRKTRYGLREKIDGNAIDFERLAKLVGLDSEKSFTYEFNVRTIPNMIFDKIQVDWFDLVLGRSSVHVSFAGDACLPALLPLPAAVYVDLRDTVLGEYVPEKLQGRGLHNRFGKYILASVPAKLLHYRNENLLPYDKRNESSAYPVSAIYQRVNMDTTQFTFNVPNVLDCALTAFFFIKVVAPLMQELNSAKAKS